MNPFLLVMGVVILISVLREYWRWRNDKELKKQFRKDRDE